MRGPHCPKTRIIAPSWENLADSNASGLEVSDETVLSVQSGSRFRRSKDKERCMNVGKEVAALKRMTVRELRMRYADVFGEETRAGNA